MLDSGRQGSPKYLNSPESPIYHKGQVLYGLSWAKNVIRREEVALVVEGYMDVVALASAGFENVVAPLGTALTAEQAALLRRYTTKVCLLFDSDPAGLKATFRAGDTLLAGGLHPSVVTLPPGEDPDTIVRKEGSVGLRAHIDRAVDVLDRKLQILDERDHFADIERTRSAIDRLLPTIRAARDTTLRDIYVAKVAERTGVRRETLEEELNRAAHRVTPPPPRRPRARGMATPTIPPMGAERELLLLMTKDRDWIERVGRTTLSRRLCRSQIWGGLRVPTRRPRSDTCPGGNGSSSREGLGGIVGGSKGTPAGTPGLRRVSGKDPQHGNAGKTRRDGPTHREYGGRGASFTAPRREGSVGEGKTRVESRLVGGCPKDP